MNIRILYCVPCGYKKRALTLADALRQRFDAKVTVEVGKLGQFDVLIDEELVASIGKSMIERVMHSPPNAHTVVSVIEQYLTPEDGEYCELPSYSSVNPDKKISARIFSAEDAKRFYDRFGKKQDFQFYENRAIECLLTHSNFTGAASVFEYGCGTGRFAARILSGHLPHNARYVGVDISTTMIKLAQERLANFPAERAMLHIADGTNKFAEAGGSFDRFVATYVLDLLSEQSIHDVLQEAHRLLRNGGLLCIAGLAEGTGFISRNISKIWNGLYAIDPAIVGGCRAVPVRSMLDSNIWSIQFYETVTSWGICSEVLIAIKK